MRLCLGYAYDQGGTNHDSMWQVMEVRKDCTGQQPCLMKVEDELCKILNGVDVVVRRWGDERHSRLAAPQVGNVGGHLLAGQLASLACAQGRVLSDQRRCSSHVAASRLSSTDSMLQKLLGADGSVWSRFSSMQSLRWSVGAACIVPTKNRRYLRQHKSSHVCCVLMQQNDGGQLHCSKLAARQMLHLA